MSISTACRWIAVALAFCAPASLAQDWPDVYDPFTLLTLNLEMDPGDWNTIRQDESFEIEVPAMFGADGEDPILVAVRRKSATPIGPKISLKIDINKLVDGQSWHSLKKLSLENGDDTNVVAEGLAWLLHRRAAEESNSGYLPGLASWVRLLVNGDYQGVYVNVEQRDKQWLRNRDLYTRGETWLYKMSDINSPERKVGDTDSPTHEALCYPPFTSGRGQGDCETPGEQELAEQLNALIDVDVMLTLAASNAFLVAPDAMFSHGKNFYYADFRNSPPRLYIPWDLDSVITSVDESIYGRRRGQNIDQSPYQMIILNHPEFRQRYNRIMLDLLAGAFRAEDVIPVIDQLEELLTPALEADENNNMEGDVPGAFDKLREWMPERAWYIREEIGVGCSRSPEWICDGDVDGDGQVNPVDSGLVQAAFGSAEESDLCQYDVDCDGQINPVDSGIVQSLFGTCEAPRVACP